MTQMKQARLSAAVAAAMGVSIAPLSAQAQDTNAPEGYSASGAGQAVIIPYYTVQNGWGTTVGMTNTTDAALLVKVRMHEAYNSRDVLDFNVMLSPYDMWMAALQPNEATGGARIVVPDGERSCLSPDELNENRDANGNLILDLITDAYTGPNADSGPQDEGRLREGYVEFLVIGECRVGESCYQSLAATNNGGTAPGIGYLVEHIEQTVGGETVWRPRDCSAADQMGVSHVQFPSATIAQNMSFSSRGTGQYSSGVPGSAAMAAGAPADLAMRAGAPLWLGPVEGVVNIGGTNYFDGTPTGAGWGGVRHPSPLRGAVQYNNFDLGLGGGAEALHLESVVCSSDGQALVTDPTTGDALTMTGTLAKTASATVPHCNIATENNLIATSQDQDFFLEPTIATMPKGLWDSQGLAALESRFTWAETFSEWANNSITQTYTDWVINFPTKGFHVDRANDTNISGTNCDILQANWNGWRVDGTGFVGCGTTGYGAETAPLAPFNNAFRNGKAEIRFAFEFWDREERSSAAGTIVSPGSVNIALPYETNVLTFRTEGEEGVLSSAIAENFDVMAEIESDNATGSTRGGWANLVFANYANNELNPAIPDNYLGLPVYAISFTTQQVTAMGQPFPTGYVTKHGYHYQKQ